MRLVVMKLITAALEGQQRDNPQTGMFYRWGFQVSRFVVCLKSIEAIPADKQLL